MHAHPHISRLVALKLVQSASETALLGLIYNSLGLGRQKRIRYKWIRAAVKVSQCKKL